MSWKRWGVFMTLIFIFMMVMIAAPAAFASSSEAGPVALQTCTNLLINSDLESSAGWVFGNTPAQASYVTDRYQSPYRSVLLGIISGPNKKSYSSMEQQVVVPSGSLLRLRAHVYPLSQPYDGNDKQELIIMHSTGQPLRRVWTSISNAQAWQTLEFDISEFIGMPIGIYFNVYNDGKGGVSAMYIDDVALEICGGATAAPVSPSPTPSPSLIPTTPTTFPTATPTPTTPAASPTTTPIVATPTPTVTSIIILPTTQTPIVSTPTPVLATPTSTQAPLPSITPVATVLPSPTSLPPGYICAETLVNGGFESGEGWRFGDTKLRGHYTSARAHSGMRSALLGNDFSRANVRSYSSIRQNVFLPADKTMASLEFWYWNDSDLEPGDYQEVVLLDGRTMRTLKILWRTNSASSQWEYKRFDISQYLGRNIVVYFNVYNNGGQGRAAMLVDDVSLKVCGPLSSTIAPPVQTTSVPTLTSYPAATIPDDGASPAPADEFIAPAATLVTPIPSPTHVMSPTTNPSPWPTKMLPQLEDQTNLQSPLNLLWYMLIFAVIILIFIIAYLLIRQIWGQVVGEGEEEGLNHENAGDAALSEMMVSSPVGEETATESLYNDTQPAIAPTQEETFTIADKPQPPEEKASVIVPPIDHGEGESDDLSFEKTGDEEGHMEASESLITSDLENETLDADKKQGPTEDFSSAKGGAVEDEDAEM